MNFVKASNWLLVGGIILNIASIGVSGMGEGKMAQDLVIGSVFLLSFVLAVLSLFGFGRVPGQPYRVPWIPLTLGVCLLLVVVITAVAEIGRGQRPVVDAEYHFRLESPGPGWTLLPRDKAWALNKQAVAGAQHGKDLICLVLVERTEKEVAFAGKEQEIGRRMIGNMALRDKRVVSCDAVEFQGRPAVRYQVVGVAGELTLRYENTVFADPGLLYQIIVWGAADQTAEDGSSFKPVLDAFTLLPRPEG